MLVKNPFHFIKHWYYTVWVDAIVFCKKKHNDIYIFPFRAIFMRIYELLIVKLYSINYTQYQYSSLYDRDRRFTPNPN